MVQQIGAAKLKVRQVRHKYRTVRKQFFYYSEHFFPELESDKNIAHVRAQATSFDTGLPIRRMADYAEVKEIHRNSRGMTVSSACRLVVWFASTVLMFYLTPVCKYSVPETPDCVTCWC